MTDYNIHDIVLISGKEALHQGQLGKITACLADAWGGTLYEVAVPGRISALYRGDELSPGAELQRIRIHDVRNEYTPGAVVDVALWFAGLNLIVEDSEGFIKARISLFVDQDTLFVGCQDEHEHQTTLPLLHNLSGVQKKLYSH